MLVGAHGPAVEGGDEIGHTGIRLGHRVVVVREVVVDRNAEAVALVLEHVAEGHPFFGDAERNERRDQGGVGVDKRAVEVEDGNDGGHVL